MSGCPQNCHRCKTQDISKHQFLVDCQLEIWVVFEHILTLRWQEQSDDTNQGGEAGWNQMKKELNFPAKTLNWLSLPIRFGCWVAPGTWSTSPTYSGVAVAGPRRAELGGRSGKDELCRLSDGSGTPAIKRKHKHNHHFVYILKDNKGQ